MNNLEKLNETNKGSRQNPYKSNDLLKILNDSWDIQSFIENKINTRNSIIEQNSTLSKDEKNRIKQNYNSFKRQVENNEIILKKYKWRESEILKNIFQTLSQKRILRAEYNNWLNSEDIKLSLIWWNIIIELPNEYIDKDFWESFQKITITECEIWWLKYSPIIIRRNCENKDLLISQELQHFYNKFLFNYTDTIKDIIGSALADKTIAQTILPTHWKTPNERKLYLSTIYSLWTISRKIENHHSFWSFLEGKENSTKLYLNEIARDHLDNLETARKLKNAWVENYTDILAVTPIEKRKDLEKIYLKKE